MIATIFPFGILSEEFVNTIIVLVLCSPLNAAVIGLQNEILLGKNKGCGYYENIYVFKTNITYMFHFEHMITSSIM